MTVAGPLLVLLAFAFALFLLSQPFWPGQVERAAETDALRRADLEAAKIAKYREIRDAALDHSTGKLSDADWKPIDARLRTEAVAILDELDGLAHLHGAEGEREELPAGAAIGTPADPATARDAARAGDFGEPGEGATDPEASDPVTTAVDAADPGDPDPGGPDPGGPDPATAAEARATGASGAVGAADSPPAR